MLGRGACGALSGRGDRGGRRRAGSFAIGFRRLPPESLGCKLAWMPFQRAIGATRAFCGWVSVCAERHPRLWVAGICALFAIQISPWWYPVPDGAHYLSVARSVAEGGPIRRLGMSNIGHFPGYMALIWPPFLLQDRPFLLLSIQQWIFAAVLVLGVHRWFARTTPGAAVLLTAIALSTTAVWELYRRTLSEIAFTAALIWAANLIRSAEEGAGHRGSWARFGCAGLCVMLAVLIRPAGCALAAGFGASVLLAVMGGSMGWAPALRRSAVVCLPAAVALAGTILAYRVLDAPDTGHSHTYLDDIVVAAPGWFPQIAEGVRLRICEVGRLLIPGMFKAYAEAGRWLEAIVCIHMVFFAFIAWGWWRWVRRRRDALALAIPFYMGIHAMFPFEQGTRYVMPIAVPLLASLWFGLAGMGADRKRYLVVLLIAHLCVSMGFWICVDAPMARGQHLKWPGVDGVASVISDGADAAMVYGLPMETYSMLLLATDRMMEFGGAGTPVREGVRWVVMPAGTEPLPGFWRHSSPGDYQVLRCR